MCMAVVLSLLGYVLRNLVRLVQLNDNSLVFAALVILKLLGFA